MKRTTVMLPDDVYALLDRERYSRDVSMAQVLREAVEAYIATPASAMDDLIGIGDSGDPDLAARSREIVDQEWGSEAGYRAIMYGEAFYPPADGDESAEQERAERQASS